MAIQLNKISAISKMPNLGSSDLEWINWFDDLRKRYGRTDYVRIFTSAWKKRGGSTANTVKLRKYLGDYKIEIDESIWNKIADLGGDITDSFGSFMKVGKWAGIAVGSILLIGIGVFVFNIAKSPNVLLKGGK
jgi:hypothetical protein